VAGYALILFSVAVLLGMALWFGVSAVQLGFVAGTLASALFKLPDIIRARHLFALCAFFGAAVNALLAWTAHAIGTCACASPPDRNVSRGRLSAVDEDHRDLVSHRPRIRAGRADWGMTLGKASPYLVNAVGSSSWRVNVAWTSLSLRSSAARSC